MIETIPSASGATDLHVKSGDASVKDSVSILKSNRAHLTPFSEKATRLLSQEVGQYSERLRAEAIKISKLHQSEQVSLADVERAAQYLLGNFNPKSYRLMSAAGGLLLSMGGSGILTIMTSHQFSNSGLVIVVLLMIAGTALLAASFAKD